MNRVAEGRKGKEGQRWDEEGRENILFYLQVSIIIREGGDKEEGIKRALKHFFFFFLYESELRDK